MISTTSYPDIDHVLQYFEYSHLPAKLQGTSAQFAEVANALVRGPLGNATYRRETLVALRKLLEAKDAAVRARLHVE